MATEVRIALFAGIVATGLAGALLFPRSSTAPVQSDAAAPSVSFRPAEQSAPARSTLLKPVESGQQTTAPTASTQGILNHLPPVEAAEPSPAERESPPTFAPEIRPDLPRLTDEPLFGEFMEPAGTELPSGAWEQPKVEQEVDGLVPVAPRTSEPAAAVARQTVEKPARLHIVRDGDTLERLARRYLGDADRYREIYAMNAEKLISPEVLPLGAKIKIPPRDPPTRRPNTAEENTVPPLLDEAKAFGESADGTPANPLRGGEPPLEPIRRDR